MENPQAAMSDALTRRQREIFEYLREHASEFARPPTLDELCEALGLRSRGSLHKHVQALVDAGLVEPLAGRRRGLRLTEQALEDEDALPLLGYIAAGRPIEAVEVPEWVQVPSWLRSGGRCYVLQVRGDSMIDEGILDGDWVIIEQRDCARNGQIVVALIDDQEATLKRIEQHADRIVLHPANARMEPMIYAPERIRIQGILVGQMRRYG
jgi:repressor LexA